MKNIKDKVKNWSDQFKKERDNSYKDNLSPLHSGYAWIISSANQVRYCQHLSIIHL